MEGIMLKVNELFDLLTQKNVAANKREANLNVQKSAQGKVGEEQAAEKAKLAEREVAVSKIESVVELNNENKRLASEIAQNREKLARDTQAYNERIAKENATLNEKRSSITQDEKTLKEGQAKLEKDKVEFKEKAIKSLVDKLT